MANTSVDAIQRSLADPQINQCPYPYFADLRHEDPVHFDPGIGMYIVSRYADVIEALRQPLLFSSELGFLGHRQPYDDEIDELMRREGYGPMAVNFVSRDPPEHARVRSLTELAFTARRIADMDDYISRTVNELVDAFIERRRAEIVEELALPLPMFVIADQLGMPRSDLPRFRRWSDATIEPFGRLLSRERAFECARELLELQHYLVPIIEDRRAQPKDDLISELVHARIEGHPKQQLDLLELLMLIRSLLVAGNETTTTAIGNAVLLLAQNPEAFAGVQRGVPAREKALRLMTEEILRIQAPTMGLPRTTTADTTLGGTFIPKGSQIYLCYGSANHDEARFTEATCFDPTRKNAMQHLSFGAGIHRCVGASLARMELKCVIRSLTDRLQNVRLSVDASTLRYQPNIMTHALVALPIVFDPMDASLN